MVTDRDRHDVMRWRGLEASVLAELDGWARLAIKLDHQTAVFEEAMRSRARCLELRAEHGLGIFQKLRS